MDLKLFSLTTGARPEELNVFEGQASLDDITRHLPQGLYSTFRTFSGGQKVLGFQSHLDRLYSPSLQQGIIPSVTAINLRENLRQIISLFLPFETRIRISLALHDNPGQVFVIIEPLKLPPQDIYKNGVHVVTTSVHRNSPRLKSTSFIQSSAAERKLILKEGIYEALMVNNSRILEGLTSNFYAVKDDTIITAQKGILLGITRRAILRVLRRQGVKIELSPLRIADIPLIDEAFITSSSRGVVPVVRIDNLQMGQGNPGALTAMLRQGYDHYVLEKAENI